MFGGARADDSGFRCMEILDIWWGLMDGMRFEDAKSMYFKFANGRELEFCIAWRDEGEVKWG